MKRINLIYLTKFLRVFFFGEKSFEKIFDFTYNAKNIEHVIFFVDNNDFVTKKQNVVVNYNKLLKIFINFRFSLLVKVIRIKFYVIYYCIKFSFNSFFYRLKLLFNRIVKYFFNIVNVIINNKKFVENFVVKAAMSKF